jgi:hypothetical protein
MVFHLATDDTAVYGEHHGGPVGQDHRVVVGQPVRLSLTEASIEILTRRFGVT